MHKVRLLHCVWTRGQAALSNRGLFAGTDIVVPRRSCPYQRGFVADKRPCLESARFEENSFASGRLGGGGETKSGSFFPN